jgi:hypothetical protein
MDAGGSTIGGDGERGEICHGSLSRIDFGRDAAYWLCVGGTILAADCALRDGVAFNISGGFHHAFPDHREGFNNEFPGVRDFHSSLSNRVPARSLCT